MAAVENDAYPKTDGLNMQDKTIGSPIKWVPLTATYVEYPSGDIIGKMFAIFSMIPLVIIVGFAVFLYCRRVLHTVFFFCGTVLNEAVNWILKHMIKEVRPCREREVLYSEYGMPSNHAQFIWFFATYNAFFLLYRLHHGNNNSFLDTAWKYTVTASCLFIAVMVSYSRIYLQYHTWKQVFCGALLGLVLACSWFAATQILFTPLFPYIASWRISEFLMIRDLTLIPNVMFFEYTCHRAEARNRQRKLVSMKSQ